MFKVTQNGENRLDMEMSGRIDLEDMKVALDELIGKSKNFEKGVMLCEISDFHLPTVSAIGLEFTRLPALFGLLKKFDRAAVLADEDWLKKISELEGAIFPGIDIKAFGRDKKAEAEAWLSS